MWKLKVWKPNRKESFVLKTETLEEMGEFRDASIRLGYFPNKKCHWEIQPKMER
jgi:hypothetical protein